MKLKQAIKILEEQKQKVLSSEHPNNEQWTFETASYIRGFFGFESTEYSWIAQFKWHIETNEDLSDNEIKDLLSEKPNKVVLFLDNCKGVLKNKGLLKESKKNLLSDKSNFEIVLIIIGIIVFWFWIGYWVKEFEIFSVMSRA